MKKNYLIALAILTVVILTAFFAYFIQVKRRLPEASAPENQARVFKVGSWWQYKTTEATVTVKITSLKKIGKEKAFVYEYKIAGRKTKPQGVYYLHTEKGLWLAGVFAGETSLFYYPPPIIFKNPLKIGSYWETFYERSDLPKVKFVYKSKITRFFKAKIKGKKEAEEINCYLIEQSTYPLSQPDRIFRKTEWYSPELGIVYHASKGEMSSTQSTLFDYKLKF